MTTDQEKEDNVLRRMLATKPTPHKPKLKSRRAVARPGDSETKA